MKGLLDEYMYTGTCMISAGVCLQSCVCGALLRPVKELRSDTQEDMGPAQTTNKKVTTVSYISKERECGKENYAFQDDNQSPVIETTSDDVSKKRTKDEQNHSSHKVNTYRRCAMLGNSTFIFCGLTIFGYAGILATFESVGYSLAKERHLSNDDIAFYLSVIEIADIICRPVFGIVLDIPRIKPFLRYIYAGITILNGISLGLMYFANNLPWFTALGAWFCTVKGTIIAQKAGLMIDLFGWENMLSALGMLYVWFGLGMFVGPLIAGKYC